MHDIFSKSEWTKKIDENSNGTDHLKIIYYYYRRAIEDNIVMRSIHILFLLFSRGMRFEMMSCVSQILSLIFLPILFRRAQLIVCLKGRASQASQTENSTVQKQKDKTARRSLFEVEESGSSVHSKLAYFLFQFIVLFIALCSPASSSYHPINI